MASVFFNARDCKLYTVAFSLQVTNLSNQTAHSGSNAQTQQTQASLCARVNGFPCISMDFHGFPWMSISWGLLHLILLGSSPDLHSQIAVSFSKHSSPSQDLVVSNSQDSRSCYNSQRQLHVSESLDSRCPMLSWEYPNLPGHSLAGPANWWSDWWQDGNKSSHA